MTYLVARDTIDDFVQTVLENESGARQRHRRRQGARAGSVGRRARRAAARAAGAVVRVDGSQWSRRSGRSDRTPAPAAAPGAGRAAGNGLRNLRRARPKRRRRSRALSNRWPRCWRERRPSATGSRVRRTLASSTRSRSTAPTSCATARGSSTADNAVTRATSRRRSQPGSRCPPGIAARDESRRALPRPNPDRIQKTSPNRSINARGSLRAATDRRHSSACTSEIGHSVSTHVDPKVGARPFDLVEAGEGTKNSSCRSYVFAGSFSATTVLSELQVVLALQPGRDAVANSASPIGDETTMTSVGLAAAVMSDNA